ncbi:MAG: TetR/AcrR family transcriptional regulator [Amylibacter sp.]
MTRKGYHHGNLKQALIEATIKLIEEKGPTGFTILQAAKQAGVSAAAPYRHFKGREDLITEVAKQGFAMFADLLEYAYTKGSGSPVASLEATGRAYLAFARKHPGHYIAMFESGVSINADPDLAAVANRAINVLVKAADNLSSNLPTEKRPPSTMVSQHIWAMSHGIVELYARGEPGARSPFTPEDLLETGLGIYLRGLGVLPKDD